MNILRVVMVADFPKDPKKINGGVQAVSAYLVEGLQKLENIELHVVCFDKDVSEHKVIKDRNKKVHLLPKTKKARNITFFHKDGVTLRKCLDSIKPDLVHAQDASVEGYLVTKSVYPSVITFHGMIGEDAKYKATFKERLRFKFLSWVAETYCVKYARYKILISPYVKRYYGKRLKGDSCYIANPTKREFFELPSSKVKGRILYAGKIIKRKGLLDLINALGLIDSTSNFELHLAGSGDDREYTKEIKVRIEELGLGERVKFLGHLDENQVLEQFSQASILILPSYQETAPMVIQQAMAAEVAVVATNICGIPDQLNSGELGLLFNPGDIESCSAHLQKLLNDDEFRKKVIANAKRKALEEFHLDKVALRTMQYYTEIVEKEPNVS